MTGANGALGTSIVSNILSRSELFSNYVGVYSVRKTATASQLNKTLASAPVSHKYQTLDMDLGSLANVRKAADTLNRKVANGELPPIRALILNAGYQDSTELVGPHAGVMDLAHMLIDFGYR